MGVKLGKYAKLYYKVGGVAAAGEWIELKKVRDVTLNVDKGEADVTTRDNAGWKAMIGALKNGSVDLKMPWNTADEGFVALMESFFLDQVIGLSILDDEIDVGTGLQADFEVFKFNRTETLEEALSADITVKPTFSDTAPVWLENGAPIATGTGTGA